MALVGFNDGAAPRINRSSSNRADGSLPTSVITVGLHSIR